MNNKQLVRLLPKQKQLKKELKDNVRLQRRLAKKEQVLQDKLYLIGKVSEVFEGVPLHIWSMSKKSTAINPVLIPPNDLETQRSAHIYESSMSVGKKLRYGVNLRLGTDETFMGANWADHEKCLLIAKQWVAHGTITHERHFRDQA